MNIWDWTSFYIGYFAGGFTIAAIMIALIVAGQARALRKQRNEGHY